MTDYISREAAIKRFTFATLDCLGMEPTILASDVVLALQSIPAADVQPVVRGKWTEKMVVGGFAESWESTCSICGEGFRDIGTPHFCPNCGAMLEES